MSSTKVFELQQRMIALHCISCGKHKGDCRCRPECVRPDAHVYLPESNRVHAPSATWVQCIFCAHWTVESFPIEPYPDDPQPFQPPAHQSFWDTLPQEKTMPELPDDGLGFFRGLKSVLAIYILTIAIAGMLALVYMAVTL